MDRTREFDRFVAHALGSGSAQSAAPGQQKPPARHQYRQFAAAASEVARDIHKTSLRLAELTRLVRAPEHVVAVKNADRVQQLAVTVKADIQRLQESLTGMEQVAGEQKKSAEERERQKHNSLSSMLGLDQEGQEEADSPGAGAAAGPGVQEAGHDMAVVSSLKAKLFSTTTDLQAVLVTRSERMQQRQGRVARLGAMASSLRPPSLPAQPFGSNQRPAAGATLGGAAAANGSSAYGGASGLSASEDALLEQAFQEVDGSQLTQAGERAYVQDRGQAVDSIQRHMNDLGQLFGRLSTLVESQGETVERIGTELDDSLDRLERGQDQLVQAHDRAHDNRLLALKVVGILLLFAILFVLFFA